MQKKLTATNINYKILTGLKDFNLPQDTDVVIEFLPTGHRYIGHTHKTQLGRIDRLANLFNSYSFSEGDICEFQKKTSDYITMDVSISNSNPTNTYSGSHLSKKQVRPTETICKSILEQAAIEKSQSLAMPDNVPRMRRFDCNIFMPNVSGYSVWACSNNNFVVMYVSRIDKFIVFHKKTANFKKIDIKRLQFSDNRKLYDDITMNGMTITENNELYFSADNVIYNWKMETNVATKVYAVSKKKDVTCIVQNDNTIFYTAITPSGKTLEIGNINGYKAELKNDYGFMCGSQIVTWTDDDVVINNGLLFTLRGGRYFYIYDLESQSMRDAKECVNNYISPSASDVRFRTFINRFKHSNDVSFGDYEPYSNSNYFCDDKGTAVYVTGRGYDFICATDSTRISLSKTYGAGVPEDFLMIDAVTALVRINDDLYGIYDFERGKAYGLNI